MASKAFSLYDFITTFKSKKDYKVTRLSQYLIQGFARDVCQTRWEVSSLCQDLVRARLRYDEIHTLIGLVESSNDDDAAWDAFAKYPEFLDELERALFDLSVALDKEDELFGELEHDIDIEISDLTVLLQLLERVVEFSVKKQNVFGTSGFNRSLRRIYALVSGWFMSIKALVSSRGDKKYPSMQKTFVCIERMMDQMRGWDQTNTLEHEAKIRIRIAFSRALFVLAVLRSLKKGDLPELIWRDIEIEAERIIPDTRFEPGDLGWTDIIEFFEKLERERVTPEPKPEPEVPYKAKLPGFYEDMKRKAAEIRRPYFSQAVTVVRMCAALARVLEVQADQREAEKSITKTFQSVLDALMAAVGAPEGTHGIISQESGRVTKSFASARSLLRTCFTSFKIHNDWSNWEAKMQSAMKRDTEHMELFINRLKTERHAERENPFSEETTTFQIEFVQKDAASGKWQKSAAEILSYEISANSTLQTLLSMEASRNTRLQERIVNLKSYFATDTDLAQMHSPTMKISDIKPGPAGIRVLKLVLAN
ncbi:hypothetical protein VNI00_008240 [Paramarasmius palmivorus]|uniref:Uncharacterized protein n=1 Tax=Paramarasmius palmivorus TaxID=297713 RepID=A0AAW0CUT4_9AGAR